jgi:hypothetical protein
VSPIHDTLHLNSNFLVDGYVERSCIIDIIQLVMLFLESDKIAMTKPFNPEAVR